MRSGSVKFTWFDPPTGNVGPDARKIGGFVYQLFDETGQKIMGGTTGPCFAHAYARVKKMAAVKGVTV